MKYIFFTNARMVTCILLMSAGLNCSQSAHQEAQKTDLQEIKLDGSQRVSAREIAHLKKQLVLMKKMVAELGKELEEIEKTGNGTTRSLKSVDQIIKEHEWVATATHFLRNHAVSIISTTCAVVGLWLSYYFNRQQIILGQAQLFWTKNGAAVKYLHELASGSYDSYAKHVKQYEIEKGIA